MMNTKELVLIYALITNQLQEFIRYDFTLDQEVREAIRHLSDLLYAKPLSYTELGRAVRHNRHKKYVRILWGRFFNAYYSVPANCMLYSKHVQDIMHDMQGAVPGKPWGPVDMDKIPLDTVRDYFQLQREGKIKLKSVLAKAGKVILEVTPLVPVSDFAPQRGTWQYKGLKVSSTKPYVSYKGKTIKIQKGTDEYNILKECIKKPEEPISIHYLDTEVCHNSNTSPHIKQNRRTANRKAVINKKLSQYKECPLLTRHHNSIILQ